MKKNVAILLFDEIEVLVFAVTNELNRSEAFNVVTVAAKPGTVRAHNGLKVIPEFTVDNCPPPHILVIPGGAGTRTILHQPSLLEWIRLKARTADLVMSVCTGALVLAKAGLLDGLRITTHHGNLAELAALAPSATVDAAQRFHDNGKILTSGGISAGIDCSLHVVARELGELSAAATARYMEYRRA